MSKSIDVWVNGERYRGVKAAAERVSRILDREISGIWLSRQLTRYGSITFIGATISAKPPEKPPPRRKPKQETRLDKTEAAPGRPQPQRQKEPKPARAALVRYPLIKAPWNRGLCRAER